MYSHDCIRPLVKNAAKFAVYDASMISAKKYHMPVTIRVVDPLKIQEIYQDTHKFIFCSSHFTLAIYRILVP